MAIGADSSLPSASKSPLRQPAPAPMQKTPSLGYQPPMINDAKVADQSNNIFAGSAGAGRAAMQSMDRAGISRGKGQQFRADMAQAGADVQAASGAAQLDMDVADANARTRQAYDTTMRGEQLANAGLLENLRAAKVRERTAGQGWQQDLFEAMRRGQFGMDSIQLDTSPLIDSLLRDRS